MPTLKAKCNLLLWSMLFMDTTLPADLLDLLLEAYQKSASACRVDKLEIPLNCH